MSFRYLFALVVILSLFAFGCTASNEAGPETLREEEREAELDLKMEAMHIAVQIAENSVACQLSVSEGCLAEIGKAYRFVIETTMQEVQ